MSDLRRFWGCRSRDFEDEDSWELVDFYETLPAESATVAKAHGLKPMVDLPLFLLAKNHDLIMAQGMTKKPKDKQLLSLALMEDSTVGAKEKKRTASENYWKNKELTMPEEFRRPKAPEAQPEDS